MSIAYLIVRLGDVCATLEKTSNVNVSKNMSDWHRLFFFAGIVI